MNKQTEALKPLNDIKNNLSDIGDMMAFSCVCGSVHFNLLKSKKIECARCGNKFGYWENNDEQTN